MATLRQINSPAVQITEIDKSQYGPNPVTITRGTSVLAMGYSDKGVAGEVQNIDTIKDWVGYYGKPTNEAEAYFYNTAAEVINEVGTVWGVKLPYDNTYDNQYKYIGLKLTCAEGVTGGSDFSTAIKNKYNITTNSILTPTILSQLNSSCFFTYTMSPYPLCMANSTYDGIIANNGFNKDTTGFTDLSFIIVNERKQTVGGLKETDTTNGMFVTVISPLDGMFVQRIYSNCADDKMTLFCSINGYYNPTAYYKAPNARFDGTSYSEDLMREFPEIQYANFGNNIDNTYFNYVTVVVADSFADPNSEGKIVINPLETFTGSLNFNAKNKETGLNDYIGTIINKNSKYIKFYGAVDQISGQPLTNGNSVLLCQHHIINIYTTCDIKTLTFTKDESLKKINGTTMVNEINKALEKFADIDEKDIDIVVDGGLSTIAHYNATSKTYDPVNDKAVADINSTSNVARWRSVVQALTDFAQNVRKDCIAILDVPRNFGITGNSKKLRKSDPDKNFSNTLAPQIKYLTGLNSSYAAMYSDWMLTYDTFRGIDMWLPPTIKASGIYTRVDRTTNYWEAPAGLNRGLIYGISDLAFNPIEKDASQLYGKSINYAKWYTGEGFTLQGQKTTQVKLSAFDRVNVRRLFVKLERRVYKMARYYVMELNTAMTRRKFNKAVTDILEPVKTAGGIYDYQVICDDTINTPEVIDNNELRCIVKIKPTKVIEYIIIDFIAYSTKGNFSEV